MHRWSADDEHWFREGTHSTLHQKLGAHLAIENGISGTRFAVWAPHARGVSVVGEWNGWDPRSHPLAPTAVAGVWQTFVPGAAKGHLYKFSLIAEGTGARLDKADPYGILHEVPPRTASVIWDLGYAWKDARWMATRRVRNALDAPLSVYEVHLGSWRRVPEEGNRWLSYREIAVPLARYAKDMGFSHVEFLPLTEHPFYGSWGYQSTGFFSPTSRYGTPQDFMHLVDTLHRHGIGVILDWVPSHFPRDEYGLAAFDGTPLYEHADPRLGLHPDWDSLIFNYQRGEVRSFLLSSALFWLATYHIDAIRVDAVASMLYLDYSRKPGEWLPNRYGGKENLEAIRFLRKLNESVYAQFPDVQTIAEESTAWPGVSRPVYVGGLGFGLKWDMGWMHDTLAYFKEEPEHRSWHQRRLTFRLLYAWSENFVLPLSHDEVVHGKGSLLARVSGDSWGRAANLRVLLGLMMAMPGKKLLFMGGEIAQWREWDHETSLDWHLLEYPAHAGMQRWVRNLNRVYRRRPAFFRRDFDPGGFEWVDADNAAQSVLSFLRRGNEGDTPVLVLANLSAVTHTEFRVGLPQGGTWVEILNSDAAEFGGAGNPSLGPRKAQAIPWQGRERSLRVVLPALSVQFLAPRWARRPRPGPR